MSFTLTRNMLFNGSIRNEREACEWKLQLRTQEAALGAASGRPRSVSAYTQRICQRGRT